MSNQQIDRKYAQYQQLLNGLQKKDPRLHDILKLITADIKGLLDVVDPMQASLDRITTSEGTVPLGPTIFYATAGALSVTFVWSTDDVNVRFYELRKGVAEGTQWADASFVLRTSSLGAAIPPLTAGLHYYQLKTLSGSLVECNDPYRITIEVEGPGIPSVSTQVIDNNVLIFWTIPSTTFAIDHYNVYKDSVKFAEVSATFTSKFEVVAGVYIYGVEAVDIAGNAGERGLSAATVQQPPDYNLLDRREIDWSLGTKVNCYAELGYLYACVDLTETFQAHFTSKSWADPQAQVTANYGLYIQENLLTGSYSEDHDYGVVLSNTIVNYNLVTETLPETSAVSVVIKTYHKVASGDAWSTALTGPSVFIPSFRYLRSVLEFTAPNDDSMIRASNYVIQLDVKRGVDSGYVTALASEGLGTTVTFNKAFKDVEAITCTSDSAGPVTIIVDFVDAPNPTTFKVLAYDSGGRRIDQYVYWIARGII